jgi:hypothetical protein
MEVPHFAQFMCVHAHGLPEWHAQNLTPSFDGRPKPLKYTACGMPVVVAVLLHDIMTFAMEKM